MIAQGRRPIVGVIDLGIGNIASVCQSFKSIGMRCEVSNKKHGLDSADLLVLPGVGAFPYAMKRLHDLDLVTYIQHYAQAGRSLLGICLGMQLLASHSLEQQFTTGLDLVPGTVSKLKENKKHIGWNSIDFLSSMSAPYSRKVDENECESIKIFHGEHMYFNHSYYMKTDDEYRMAMSEVDDTSDPIVAAVKKDNVVGLQFHPEKSQHAGRQFLLALVEDMLRA